MLLHKTTLQQHFWLDKFSLIKSFHWDQKPVLLSECFKRCSHSRTPAEWMHHYSKIPTLWFADRSNLFSHCSSCLLRTAGWFIYQRHKGQERIISIIIANKEVALMQIWVKSTHWLLLKREIIPIKHLKNRKGDISIFLALHASILRKAPSWKG